MPRPRLRVARYGARDKVQPAASRASRRTLRKRCPAGATLCPHTAARLPPAQAPVPLRWTTRSAAAAHVSTPGGRCVSYIALRLAVPRSPQPGGPAGGVCLATALAARARRKQKSPRTAALRRVTTARYPPPPTAPQAVVHRSGPAALACAQCIAPGAARRAALSRPPAPCAGTRRAVAVAEAPGHACPHRPLWRRRIALCAAPLLRACRRI